MNLTLDEPLERLLAAKIAQYIDDQFKVSANQIFIADTLPSTNDWLLAAARQNGPERVCLAENQTAGRGQYAHHWSGAPAGTNLYLSFSYAVPKTSGLVLSALPLLLGIAAIGGLRAFDLDIPLFLKWPNDLMTAAGKLGGILVESIAVKEQAQIIVGLGLNLVPPFEADHTDYLAHHVPLAQLKDRNRLVGHLLDSMLNACQNYRLFGFEPWQEAWNSLDFTSLRQIEIETPQGAVRGTALGVNEKGELMVRPAAGQLLTIASGQNLRLISND